MRSNVGESLGRFAALYLLPAKRAKDRCPMGSENIFYVLVQCVVAVKWYPWEKVMSVSYTHLTLPTTPYV